MLLNVGRGQVVTKCVVEGGGVSKIMENCVAQLMYDPKSGL